MYYFDRQLKIVILTQKKILQRKLHHTSVSTSVSHHEDKGDSNNKDAGQCRGDYHSQFCNPVSGCTSVWNIFSETNKICKLV